MFANLKEAALDHRLVLAACEDRSTGRRVNVVCESYVENGVTMYNPIARLFDGNPYNEVTPPGVAADKLI